MAVEFTSEIVLFLLLVGIGSLIQTITGFAMGLIIMGGVALFSLADLAAAAAVVSLISLVNVTTALRRTYRHVDTRILAMFAIGMIPFVVLGVLILENLSGTQDALLELLLGLFIVTAGSVLMLKPNLYDQPSGKIPLAVTGASAGLMAGMYGAGGAPLAYLMYRQPLLIQTVRATLLSTFAVSTLFRTGFIAAEGFLTVPVLTLAALSVPVVVIATLLGGRLSPLLPEAMVRRAAFVLLALMGGSLVVSAGLGGL